MNNSEPTLRTAPHSIDAEMCLLASMMLEKDIALEVLAAGAERGWFYVHDHAILFDEIKRITSAGHQLDAVILRDALKANDRLEEIGGTKYIAQVLGSVPSAAHGMEYARIVREKAMLRGIIQAANRAINKSYEEVDSAEQILADTQADFAKAGDARTLNHSVNMAMVMERGKASIRTAQDGKTLVQFGFKALDRYLGGVAEGEVTIIGARPSMGKSTIARQIAVNIASRGISVLYISLEESDAKIGRNVLSWKTGIENHHLRRGTIQKSDWVAIDAKSAEMESLPIHVVTGIFDINRLGSIVASMKARHGIRVLMLDYLQIMEVPHSGRMNDTERVTEAARWLSRLTKRLKLHTISLVQLNREVTKRDDKRPNMADIRSSGQIEQDADTILLLHREDYYKPNPAEHTKLAELIGAKVRDGARSGTYLLDDYLEYQAFEDVPLGRSIPHDLSGALTGRE